MKNAKIEETEGKQTPIMWARDHRMVFANSFAMRVSENDLQIEFATEQEINGDKVQFSQCQIQMTLKSAKVLQLSLSGLIANLEKIVGQIPISPEIKKSIAENSVQVVEKVAAKEGGKNEDITPSSS